MRRTNEQTAKENALYLYHLSPESARLKKPIISRLAEAKSIFQALIILVCVGFFARWLSSNLTSIQSVWSNINWFRLLVSFGLLSMGFLLLPSAMLLFIRNTGQGELSYLQSARAYFGSQIAKYLPGGVWVYPSRLIVMREMGLDLSASTMALGFETVALVTSSLLVSMITLSAVVIQVLSARAQVLIVLTCISATLVLVVSPELLSQAPRIGNWLPQSLQNMRAVPMSDRIRILLVAVTVYSGMWILMGTSFYVLINALSDPISIRSIPVTVGAFTFAWLVGFISVFSPGGIGVREGVIVVLLSTIGYSPFPILAAVFSRIVWSVAEFIFFSFSLLIGKYSLARF